MKSLYKAWAHLIHTVGALIILPPGHTKHLREPLHLHALVPAVNWIPRVAT